MGQDMQGYLQYGVTEERTAMDGEIHLVDQDGQLEENGEAPASGGVINTQHLIDDMAFLKNQLQCELIRLKNAPLKSPSGSLPPTYMPGQASMKNILPNKGGLPRQAVGLPPTGTLGQ